MSNTLRLLLGLLLVTASTMCPPGDDYEPEDEYEFAPPTRPSQNQFYRQQLRQQRQSIAIPDEDAPLPNYTLVNKPGVTIQGTLVNDDDDEYEDIYGTAGGLPGAVTDESNTDVPYGTITAIRYLSDDDYEQPVPGDGYEKPVPGDGYEPLAPMHAYETPSTPSDEDNEYEDLRSLTVTTPSGQVYDLSAPSARQATPPQVPASARPSVGSSPARASAAARAAVDVEQCDDNLAFTIRMISPEEAQKQIKKIEDDLKTLESSYNGDNLQVLEQESRGIMSRLRARLSSLSLHPAVAPHESDLLEEASKLVVRFNGEYKQYAEDLVKINGYIKRDKTPKAKEEAIGRFKKEYVTLIQQAKLLQTTYPKITAAIALLKKFSESLTKNPIALHNIKALGDMTVADIEKTIGAEKGALVGARISGTTKFAELTPGQIQSVMEKITRAQPFLIDTTKGNPLKWFDNPDPVDKPIVKSFQIACKDPYAVYQMKRLLQGKKLDTAGLEVFVGNYKPDAIANTLKELK